MIFNIDAPRIFLEGADPEAMYNTCLIWRTVTKITSKSDPTSR